MERRVRLTTSYKSLDSFGLGNKRLMVSQLPATRDYTLGHTEPRGRVHTVQDGGLDVSRAGGRPGGWADGGSGAADPWQTVFKDRSGGGTQGAPYTDPQTRRPATTMDRAVHPRHFEGWWRRRWPKLQETDGEGAS